MDFTDKVIITEPPFNKGVELHVCGVYFIYFINNHLYIGMSGDLKPRISSHNTKFEKYIERVEYIKCNSLMRCKQLEKQLTNAYNPDMNHILSYTYKAINIIIRTVPNMIKIEETMTQENNREII